MEIQSRGHAYGVKHFLSPESGPLAAIISKSLGLTEEQVQELLQIGAVYKSEVRTLNPQDHTTTGDLLRVHTTPRRYKTDNITREIIIYENADFIIINKPAGIPVHATVDNFKENVLTVLSENLKIPLKITHRLDIATQGLMLLAKTDAYQKLFNNYISESKVTKIYRAIVTGENIEPNKTHVHFMEPSPRAPKKVQQEPVTGWAKCILSVLQANKIADDLSEVKIHLKTGRTHQIRAQMAALGHPLVADKIYGGAEHPHYQQLFLQSAELAFPEGTFQLM